LIIFNNTDTVFSLQKVKVFCILRVKLHIWQYGDKVDPVNDDLWS